MVFSPFRLGAMCLQIYVPLFKDGTWENLTTPDPNSTTCFGAVADLRAYRQSRIHRSVYCSSCSLLPKIKVLSEDLYRNRAINLSFLLLDAWFALVRVNGPTYV